MIILRAYGSLYRAFLALKHPLQCQECKVQQQVCSNKNAEAADLQAARMQHRNAERSGFLFGLPFDGPAWQA